MPSIASSKQQVREGLATGPDHDAILASLQDEIDRHNRIKNDAIRDRDRRRSEGGRKEEGDYGRRKSDLRFRFKAGTTDPNRKRSRRSSDENSHGRRRRRKQRSDDQAHKSEDAPPAAAHPFPREPTNPTDPGVSDNQAAFRTSLFDALADDEAAAYWESVYSQPIHTYSRPNTERSDGGLEAMTDDEYAAYVQRRMWDKAHPEIVWEREEKERKLREDAAGKERRRQDFLRARQREEWKRAGRARTEDAEQESGRDYIFDHDDALKWTGDAGEDWRSAWKAYLHAWDELKQTLEVQSTATSNPEPRPPSTRIPWPVLSGKPATRPNIEAFLHHLPVTQELSRLQLLKTERVRWHPDKIQHRFDVEEGTLKVVTGVFQIIDGLLEKERKRGGK